MKEVVRFWIFKEVGRSEIGSRLVGFDLGLLGVSFVGFFFLF